MRALVGAITVGAILLLGGCGSRPFQQTAEGKKVEPPRRASIFEIPGIVSARLAAREHALRRAKGAAY